jgi:hypothetical protein
VINHVQTTINIASKVHFLSHEESVFPIRKDQSVGTAGEGGDPVYCEKHTKHITTAE